MTHPLLLPPYRCCGVSTRKIRYRMTNSYSYICDVCAYSYDANGQRRQDNKQLQKHQLNEVD